MKHTTVHLGLFLCALLSTACGPPRIAETQAEAGDGSDDESSSAATDAAGETSSTSTSSGETDTADESETGTEAETSETTLTFVPETEFAGESCMCDPFAQDCPEDEKCVPYASSDAGWDCTKCVPVLGDQPAGEPCMSGGPVEATDDCDGDSFCWNAQEVAGEWVGGTCRSFCSGTADNPMCPEPSSSYCMIAASQSIVLCVPYCDPLAQDCGPGEACVWASPAFTCAVALPDVGAGEACEDGACGPGLLCVMPEALPDCAGDSCCTLFCDLLLGDASCDALPGTSCVPMFEMGMEPQGYEQVGVCVLP